MFYTAENRGRYLRTSVKERVIIGKSEKNLCLCAPVVGRLIPYKNIKNFSGKEALLAVVRDEPKETDAYLFDDPRTVGIIYVSAGDENMTELPLPSICVYEIPSEYNERIALLDPERERLFLSPDISTVNRYLPRLFKKYDSPPSFVLRDGKRLSLWAVRGSEDKTCDGDVFLPLPSIKDTEELYLRCAEIAEGAVGRRVCFSLSANDTSVSSVGALMRSAVWGDLSILLCGVLTEGEFTDVMQTFCHAFCELETDRREFNGYIPRGLCIDSPYLLSVAERLYGMDFFIFDAEGLVSLFCNGRKDPPEDVLTRILTLISRVMEKRKDIPCGVILGERTLSPEFCQILEKYGIDRYATTPELMQRLYRSLL